jgi:phosphoribosylanthranilate isomerase
MRVRVKICGLSDARSVEAAVEAGADAVGFVFHPSSPRAITPGRASRLLPLVPPHVEKVAVFATPDPAVLREVEDLPFDTVQANHPWASRPGLARRLAYLPAVADGPDLAERVSRARASATGPVLVDGPRGPGLGELADHRRIAAVAWRLPIVLAGGLDPENVKRALAHVRPAGVDVSSGVESARGVKDPDRIRAFVDAVRALESQAAPAAGSTR